MVRLTDRHDMTLDVYRGRKTTIQQQQQNPFRQLVVVNIVNHAHSANEKLFGHGLQNLPTATVNLKLQKVINSLI